MSVAKTASRKAQTWSVVILHIWGSILIYGAVFGDKDSRVISDLFEPILWSIVLTLGVMAGDKSIERFIGARFGVTRVEETTKTVQTTAKEGEGA